MAGITERIDAEATQACDRIKGGIDGLISQVREDVVKTNDPRARALFETTAEVLAGLKVAYMHYEAGIEPAFQSGRGGPSENDKSDHASGAPVAPQGDSGATILGES